MSGDGCALVDEDGREYLGTFVCLMFVDILFDVLVLVLVEYRRSGSMGWLVT